jgi:hypothetical protein
MWASSVWGFYTLSASCLLAMLGLGPEWRPVLLSAAGATAFLGTAILAFPLTKPAERAKVAAAFQHPAKFIRERVKSSWIVIAMLVAFIGVSMYQQASLRTQLQRALAEHPKAPTQTPRPYYSTAEIEKMISALQELDKAIEDDMRSGAMSVEQLLKSAQYINQWHMEVLQSGTKQPGQSIEAMLKQIGNGSDRLNKALNNPEMRFLKGQIESVVVDEKKSVVALSKAVGNLYSDLTMFPTLGFDRIAIIRRDFEDVERVLPPFNEWIAASSSKIKAKITEVRGWRS